MSEHNDDTEKENKPNEKPTHSSSSDQEEIEDTDMEMIRKFVAQKLKIFDDSEHSADSEHSDDNEHSHQKVLREVSLEGIIEYIKEKENCKIVTMAGAGISTSAGIPDFRSPSSGLYHNLEKYNLPYPQAIFEVDFFTENPEPFFTLARELLPDSFKPTSSHYFIRLLHEKGLLLRHYTQNIDTLERMAGLPPEKLVEAHGTFDTGRCLKCKAVYTLPWMKEKIVEGLVPKCEKCKEGVVKPDIIFFGEKLSEKFYFLAAKDFPQADLLIIMGSSLVVEPFASLVDRVRSNCPRLLINKEKVGMRDRLLRLLGLREGLNFNARNGRDVAWLGDCDTGCQVLAEKLGWGEELKDLIEKERERLETESASQSSSH
ncbi:sirtuin 2 isoform X2 [Megachile rotundata]|uniref:sirtuin 2 isoform X2 n=1 Tax=Megachile rotundata TaxID=143995 RepID=UPI003FD24F7D